MSSHHFVKEQQEPALLILSTKGLEYENLAPLLEWSPTVVVAQEEVNKVISWGIKIDLILADLNFQQENYKLLEAQYPVKFIGVTEEAYLEEALQYLVATKHEAVNIIGFPHQKVFTLEQKLEFIDLVVWDAPLRYFPVKNGQFKKWFTNCSIQIHAPEGTFVEVLAEDQNQIHQISYATFIEVEEGLLTLKSNQVFWIGEFVAED